MDEEEEEEEELEEHDVIDEDQFSSADNSSAIDYWYVPMKRKNTETKKNVCKKILALSERDELVVVCLHTYMRIFTHC
jgi:formyltetrahydrofolate hydrolase